MHIQLGPLRRITMNIQSRSYDIVYLDPFPGIFVQCTKNDDPVGEMLIKPSETTRMESR